MQHARQHRAGEAGDNDERLDAAHGAREAVKAEDVHHRLIQQAHTFERFQT